MVTPTPSVRPKTQNQQRVSKALILNAMILRTAAQECVTREINSTYVKRETRPRLGRDDWAIKRGGTKAPAAQCDGQGPADW